MKRQERGSSGFRPADGSVPFGVGPEGNVGEGKSPPHGSDEDLQVEGAALALGREAEGLPSEAGLEVAPEGRLEEG